MKNSTKIILGVAALVIVGVLIATYLVSNASTKLSTTEFYQKAGIVLFNEEAPYQDSAASNYDYIDPDKRFAVLKADQREISSITVATYNLNGYVNKKLAYTCSFSRSDIDWDKLRAIEASGVIIDNEDPNSGSVWSSLVMPLFTIAIGILIIVIFVRQMNASNRSAFDFGRTKAQVVTESKVRFTDVAGA
ncbi:MAG: hypothetical protein J6Y44_01945, partial [Clostridia bacterium]|nr:hypothetical protein [Clostridia bacterium]